MLIVVAAVFAPLLAPYDPFQQNIVYRLEPPSAEFWLGTDSYGRDVLSRLIYGSRFVAGWFCGDHDCHVHRLGARHPGRILGRDRRSGRHGVG
ncbi:hypothetical protein LP414_12445 [Polaromonas sp. P1(28)-13]|nr:hypothetical protein LP414_12445 [Polaromonas sp. P1(28)-13]